MSRKFSFNALTSSKSYALLSCFDSCANVCVCTCVCVCVNTTTIFTSSNEDLAIFLTHTDNEPHTHAPQYLCNIVSVAKQLEPNDHFRVLAGPISARPIVFLSRALRQAQKSFCVNVVVQHARQYLNCVRWQGAFAILVDLCTRVDVLAHLIEKAFMWVCMCQKT